MPRSFTVESLLTSDEVKHISSSSSMSRAIDFSHSSTPHKKFEREENIHRNKQNVPLGSHMRPEFLNRQVFYHQASVAASVDVHVQLGALAAAIAAACGPPALSGDRLTPTERCLTDPLQWHRVNMVSQSLKPAKIGGTMLHCRHQVPDDSHASQHHVHHYRQHHNRLPSIATTSLSLQQSPKETLVSNHFTPHTGQYRLFHVLHWCKWNNLNILQ